MDQHISEAVYKSAAFCYPVRLRAVHMWAQPTGQAELNQLGHLI